MQLAELLTAGGSDPEAAAPKPSSRPRLGGLPPPRSAALLSLFVLGIGVFIGSALGSQSDTSLADAPARILVAGGAQQSAPAPASAGDNSSSSTDAGTTSNSGGGGASGGTAAGAASTQASGASTAGGGDTGSVPLDTSTTDTSGSSGGNTSTPPTPAASTLPPIKHVVAIALSGRSFDAMFGPSGASSYLAKDLRAQGETLKNYFAVTHGGLADRIALISGQGPTAQTQAGCATFADLLPGKPAAEGQVTGSGCVYPATVKTLVDQMGEKGLRARAYVEDMRDAAGKPATCQHPQVGAADGTIAAALNPTPSNPFVYFHSVTDTGDCNANVVPFDRLTADLKTADTFPSFSLLVPNRCHDGRGQACPDGNPAGLAAADAFLRLWIPQILDSTTFKQDGLLVITSDEAPSTGPQADSSGCCGAKTGAGGGRVGALLVSRYVSAGKTVTTQYNHYSLLRTLEDLFSLDHLGHAGASDVKPFAEDVFPASAHGARHSRRAR